MRSQRGQTLWNTCNILLPILGALLAVGLAGSASAQSLNPKTPTPMVAGENRGTLDCMVGPQYWSLKYKKGKGKVTVGFTSMGLLGNAATTTIEVVVHSSKGELWATKQLTSNGRAAQVEMPATYESPGTELIEVRTNGTCLVRAGGDYTLAFTGEASDFSGGGAAAAGGPDRIVGSYAVMVCAPDFDCQSSLAIRFAANGTVQTTDGHSGTWKVFDPDAMIYSVVMGQDRWSLKLVPGRGLFNTSDLSVVVFQAVR